jgi:uncharacterized membrane protein YcaP (DUF421 family)
MKREEIHFGDWKRWLFGQMPPEFMLEVLIRTVLIYFLLILAVRLMGKRMTGQVTLTEMAVMITLGAIVSPVMQLPDRGVVFGIIGLAVAYAFQKGTTWLDFRFRRMERLTQGNIVMLIKDGVLCVEALHKANISRQQLYAMLRQQKIDNLCQVKRAYLEACGILSVYRSGQNVAGLAIFPPIDPVEGQLLQRAATPAKVCCNCGHVQQLLNDHDRCELCGAEDWGEAYLMHETDKPQAEHATGTSPS